MGQPQWKKVEGRFLLGEYEGDEQSLYGVIDDKPGIYMWKLSVFVNDWTVESWDTQINKLDERLSTPIGEEPELLHKRVLIGRSYIQGKKLPKKKKQALLDGGGSSMSRRTFFVDFFKSLNDHVPTLYVGQSSNLRERTEKHLSGVEGFGKMVQDHSNSLNWDNIELHYLAFGEDFKELFGEQDEKTIRETLEWVTTVTTIAGYGNRDG